MPAQAETKTTLRFPYRTYGAEAGKCGVVKFSRHPGWTREIVDPSFFSFEGGMSVAFSMWRAVDAGTGLAIRARFPSRAPQGTPII